MLGSRTPQGTDTTALQEQALSENRLQVLCQPSGTTCGVPGAGLPDEDEGHLLFDGRGAFAV